jgi:hypothetical protein
MRDCIAAPRPLLFVLAAVLASSVGCGGGEAPFEVPEGSIGARDARVLAPGATLIHRGEVGEGALDLSEDNALVGVYRDGQAYLYHPSQGVVPIDEETSRAAVGRWLAGVGSADAGTRRTSSALTSVVPGQTAMSSPGVKLTLDAQTGRLRAENTARRWAALMPNDDGLGTVYLLPRSNILPTNAVSAIVGSIAPEIAATNVHQDLVIGESFEVLGAMGRAMPLVIAGSRPEGLAEIPEDSAQMEVFHAINRADFFHVVLEGARNITTTALPECLEPLLVGGTFSALYATLLEDLTSSNPQVARDLFYEEASSLMNSVSLCVGEAAAGTFSAGIGAVVGEIFSTFLDIVATVGWVIDDVAYSTYREVVGLSVYEKILRGDVGGACCFVRCADDTNSAGVSLRLTTARCGIVAPDYCPGSRPIYFGTTRCDDCSAQSCYDKWVRNTGG